MVVVATLSKGYDLEYIWKQVDRGPAKDAAGYYIQASESGGRATWPLVGPWRARRWAWNQARWSSANRMTCYSASAKLDDTQLGRAPGNGLKAADLYARLLAAEPHATAERRHELRLAEFLVVVVAGRGRWRSPRCWRPGVVGRNRGGGAVGELVSGRRRTGRAGGR